MKIVNLETFRKLPDNTLFAKYEPCIFHSFCIRMDVWDGDFLVTSDIPGSIDSDSSDDFHRLLDDAVENGTSLKMDFETCGRDGMFDKDQLFAIWEKQDIEQFIERLKRCL